MLEWTYATALVIVGGAFHLLFLLQGHTRMVQAARLAIVLIAAFLSGCGGLSVFDSGVTASLKTQASRRGRLRRLTSCRSHMLPYRRNSTPMRLPERCPAPWLKPQSRADAPTCSAALPD